MQALASYALRQASENAAACVGIKRLFHEAAANVRGTAGTMQATWSSWRLPDYADSTINQN